MSTFAPALTISLCCTTGTPHPLAAEMSAQLHWLQDYISTRASESDEISAAHEHRSAGRRFGLQEVLCHNDLLSGNILRRTAPERGVDLQHGERQVFLIDYEYAAYNYRAFDIANHISGEFWWLYCTCGGPERKILPRWILSVYALSCA